MLHSLIVGLGRCGAGLHLPVLQKARTHPDAAGLFADTPVIGFDHHLPAGPFSAGAVAVDTLDRARTLADPEHTVVHLCTPPAVRSTIVERLADLGYRLILVEKPLATDLQTLDELTRLRTLFGLRPTVVSHWLTSALTGRVRQAVVDGRFGRLRSVCVVQRKPRYSRSVNGGGHESAFEVEVPHALGLALWLAGPARLAQAGASGLDLGDAVLPDLGAAWLTLDHDSGVRTQILSDLAAPVRERRVTARFDGAVLTGYYPSSEADQYAQLRTASGSGSTREVFADDSLTAFFLSIYAGYTGLAPPQVDTFGLHGNVVRLLDEARLRAGVRGFDHPRPGHAARPLSAAGR